MRRPGFALPAVLALLCSGCISSLLPIDNPAAADKGAAALGSVTLHSGHLGQSTFSPNVCRAGDREFYLGGDFVDEKSGLIARLVFDPLEGAAIRIFEKDAAKDKSIVFRRDDCKRLEYSLDPTNWRINDVSDYRISFKFECARNGDSATGELSAAHCH